VSLLDSESLNRPKSNSDNFNATNNLIALCLSSFVVTVGFGVIMPFLPLYASEILSEFSLIGITIGIALQIGVLTSAFMFMRFLLAPSYGDLSDSSGRKPIILVGMSVYAFLLVGYGLVFDFLSLLILRTLQGMASAAVWPVGEALIVDTSTKEKIGRNLGYYIMSMQAGMASGPFLGFIFYAGLNDILGFPSVLSYRLTFICQGILGILATIIVAVLVKDPSQLNRNISVLKDFKQAIQQMATKTAQSPGYLMKLFTSNSDYRNLSLYTIYIVAIINGFGNAMIFPIITLFLDDFYSLEPEFIALVVGVVGLLALSGNPLGGALSDKVSRKRVTWISGLLRGIFYLILGIQMGLIVVIFVFAIQRFLWGIFQPSFRSLQNSLIPEEVRGKEFGFVQSLFNLGSVLGPIIGGALYDSFFNTRFNLGGVIYIGVGVTFALSGILSIAGSILLFLFIKSSFYQDNSVKPIDIIETSITLSEK
jgi:DHA1 family multidrug resistance protein-like MFS transporter